MLLPADDDFDDSFGFDDALNNAGGGNVLAAPNSHGGAPFRHGSEQQPFGHQQADGGQLPLPSEPPEILNCECGLQCSYIMAKTAKNDGRWFYRRAVWNESAFCLLSDPCLCVCCCMLSLKRVSFSQEQQINISWRILSLSSPTAGMLQMSKAEGGRAMPLLPVGR